MGEAVILEARMKPTTCEAADCIGGDPEFTILKFQDALGSVVELHLPLRMSACATMIAEAFNGHMRDDAATVDAQTAPSEPHKPRDWRDMPRATIGKVETVLFTKIQPGAGIPFPSGGSGDVPHALDFAAQAAVHGEPGE